MPISRLKVGTSLTRSPSIRISPPSGLKKPAAKFSSVVFPQPEGPSSVMNSPRLTASETSCSATVLPNCLVTALKRTATSPFVAVDAGSVTAALSAVLFNVQHLAQPEERVGENDQPGGADDVHHRKGGHRRI